VYSSCHLKGSEYVRTYRRKCIKAKGQTCSDNYEKNEVCKAEEAKAITFNKVNATINGTIRVVDMELNNTVLPNKILAEKLASKEDKETLKVIALRTLQKLFMNIYIDYLTITIVDLRIGSLIIDYSIEFKVEKVKNKTVVDLNPVKKETEVFSDISSYKGTIMPDQRFYTGNIKSFLQAYTKCSLWQLHGYKQMDT